MSRAAPSARRSRLPAVRVFRDRADRHHFALAKDTPDACLMWDANVRWLLTGQALALKDAGFLLGCLLLLDGVVNEPDLRLAWSALSNVYRDGDNACVEWHDADDRQQRRHLSAVTVLSLAAQAEHTPFGVAAQQLAVAWSVRAPYDAEGSRPSLGNLIEQTQCAVTLMLSGDLAAHAMGRQRLTAVSRACLVRRRSGAALRVDPSCAEEADEAPSIDVPDTSVNDAALDAVSLSLLDAVHGTAAGTGQQLIAAITQACRHDPNALPGAAHQRATMVARLRELAPAAEAAGSWLALLLFGALRLVTYGTRLTHPLAPNSISAYVALSLKRVFDSVREHRVEDAHTFDFPSAYDDMLADPAVPESQLGKLAAALTALHDVFVTVLGVPPLGTRLSPEFPMTRVSANVIWPHEIDCVLDWLDQAPAEDRLLKQAQAMLAILAAAPCRFEDMLHIHLFGVRPDGDVIRIAIDPLPSAGDGKSPASRRTIDIVDKRSVAVLQAWLDRRHEEGAMPRDLLFGDPNDGRRPFRPGASMGVINALLKAASGDPDVGTHELRHTYLSLSREKMGAMDQRSLDGASAAAGHEWTSTTLKNYCHLYESPLRSQLDARLHRIALTERTVCGMTGIKLGTLRQRRHRCDGAAVDLAWRALGAAASSVVLPDVSVGFTTGLPLNPLSPASAALTFKRVFAALRDRAEGHSVQAIVLRQALDAQQMQALERAVSDWVNDRHRAAHPEQDKLYVVPWPNDWSRASQPKWLMVRRALEGCPLPRLLPVVKSWASTCAAQHVRLEAVERAMPLLQYLACSGLCGSQLVLCHEPEADATKAVEMIAAVFGSPPSLRSVRPRRGRAKAYMTVASTEVNDDRVGNAATSVAGLHVLMFAAWVWTRVGDSDHD